MLFLCRQFCCVLNQPESEFLGRKRVSRARDDRRYNTNTSPYTAHHYTMSSPVTTVGGIPRRIVNLRKDRLLLLLRTNNAMHKNRRIPHGGSQNSKTSTTTTTNKRANYQSIMDMMQITPNQKRYTTETIRAFKITKNV